MDQETRERIKNGLGRYDVIRNSDQAGDFWSVIDKSKRTMVEGRYVSDHRSNRAAWRTADKLNIQHEESQSS